MTLVIAASMAAVCPSLAQDFASPIKLKVFVRGTDDTPDRMIGFMPARHGRSLHIPEGKLWYVRPMGALSGIQLDALARLLKSQSVPGLDLSDHWEISDASLRHLRRVSRLRMLDVSRTRLTDNGVAFLRIFTQLQVLILPEAATDRGLAGVKNLLNLRELTLDQTHVTDEGLSTLVEFPHLRRLDLSSTLVTDVGAAVLSKLPELRQLTLGSLVTEASAPSLEKLKSLEEIDISQTQIGEKGLAALATLPQLKTIYLGKHVTEEGLKRLSRSHSLRSLDLSRTNVTLSGVRYVAELKTLQEVALSQTAIGDECLPFLATLPELRMLDLSETRVTSAGLDPLARLKKLEILSLSWQTLTRDDLQAMSKLKQLKTVVLNGVPLLESTMVQLRRLTPWDRVAGIERAGLREKKRVDPLAARVEPTLTGPALRTGALPEIPPPSGASAKPLAVVIASRETNPVVGGRITLFQRDLKGPSEGKHSRRRDSRAAPVLRAAAPEKTLPSSPGAGPGVLTAHGVSEPSTEDNLLRVIALQSNPSRAGAFSGLSGMRQLRQTETLASLNNLTAAPSPAGIPAEDDSPDHSLGEISVGVSPSIGVNKRVGQ